MGAPAIEPEQRTAARVVGCLYLLTMATGVFGELFVRGRLVRGDALQTANNIAASERLFRLGVVSDLITIAGVVVLIWGLYVVLKPVSRNGALLGAILRLVGAAIGAVSVVNSLAALRLLSGPAYLRALGESQQQDLARLFISVQGVGSQVDFVFLGLGSTVLSYLWLRSGYIPRALAALGILGSLMLAVGGMAIMVFPGLASVLTLMYMIPLGIYEVGLGLWLIVKGIRQPLV